jgi:multicomponent Na+:H+ antiporter subunit C
MVMQSSTIPSVIAGYYNYWIVIVLMMIGLYIVIGRVNLIKKIVGLNLFQISVFLFYISMGKVAGGTAPILVEGKNLLYSNPLPSVLILTAIVVGISTTALALALIVRIREAYGSIEESVLAGLDHESDTREREQTDATAGVSSEDFGSSQDISAPAAKPVTKKARRP